MLHPTLTQQLAADRQRHLHHEASQHRLARLSRVARRRASAERATRPLPD